VAHCSHLIRRLALATCAGAAGLLLFPLLSAARPQQADIWTGTWGRADWGTMTVTQSGGRAKGTYTWDDGRMEGVVSGLVFKGTWNEAPTRQGPRDAGEFELRMSGDGKSFTGWWRYADGSASGDWNGTRISAPPSATAAKVLKVVLVKKRYNPHTATVASGTRVEICNGDDFQHRPFSLSSFSRMKTVVLKPGQCASVTVRNPTRELAEVKFHDEIHSQERMVLVVLPAAS
jgi:hypothetical protein